MRTEPIPVTLLTGFLGAGKTSYLNARLRRGIPPGSLILVNDFGDINIDAELIEYRDEQILRLSNGCICCTLGGSLAEQPPCVAVRDFHIRRRPAQRPAAAHCVHQTQDHRCVRFAQS